MFFSHTQYRFSPLLPFLLAISAQGQYIIDLSDVTLDLPQVGIAVDSVFTAFPIDQPVGEVIKGASKRREPVHFKRPVDVALLELFQRSLPTDSVRIRTVVKVNVLRTEEHSLRGSDVSLCSVHLEFLTRDADGIWRVYDHGTSRSDRAAHPARMNELLVEALEESFIGFWSAVTQGRMRYDPTRFSASPTSVTLLDLPILRAQDPGRGIYRSFQDFRYNTPDSSVAFVMQELTKAGDPRRRVKLLSLEPGLLRSIWGFSDGKSGYLNAGEYFVELERENDVFTTYLWAGEPMNAGTLMDMADPMTGTFPLYGWVQSEQKFIIDPLSGRWTLFSKTDVDQKIGDACCSRHVFGYSKYSTLDTTVCLYVYGGLEACFGVEHYYDFKPLRRSEFMTVELRIGDGPSVKVDLDTNDPQEQFILIKVNSGGEITADKVNEQLAMKLLSEMDPAMGVKQYSK